MMEPIGIRERRGPIVLAADGDATSSAAAAFAARVARRANVDLRVGQTSAASGRMARELDATLVVVSAAPMGGSIEPPTGHHGSSTTRAAQSCPCRPALTPLPRTCVAAVDFSAASIRALQIALLILDDCGKVMLTYVAPSRDLARPRNAVLTTADDVEVAGQFARLRAQLWAYALPGTEIETWVESGEVVDQLLSVAREVDADLIAVGLHPSRVSNRLFDFGSTAGVLRRAPCTVLASPMGRGSCGRSTETPGVGTGPRHPTGPS